MGSRPLLTATELDARVEAFEAAWGGGFLKTDRFVAMVYEDLKSRK